MLKWHKKTKSITQFIRIKEVKFCQQKLSLESAKIIVYKLLRMIQVRKKLS